VTRRHDIVLPSWLSSSDRAGGPVRLLAVSDEPDPALDDERNRDALGPIDGILGCGDLEPAYLAFLADAFRVAVVFVRGNHDRGAAWDATSMHAPETLDNAHLASIGGLCVAGLGWPGPRRGAASHDELGAWLDVLSLGRRWALRRLCRRPTPSIVVSHAPPRGLGDQAADRYHRGFGGYRWLLEVARPPLWIHGHVTPASVGDLIVRHDGTTVVNATGSVLLELHRSSDPGS
jgi:Icc-related predicted phosphoesterase